MSGKWRIILILSLLGNLAVVYVANKALEYRAHINHFLDKYTRVVAEFSAHEVYHEANIPLQADTTVPGRVVFIGSQVTRNWDLDRYFPGYEAINRGIVGQRAAGFVLRFRSDVIALHPQAVVIEISSYNLRPTVSIEEVTEYVAMMVDLAEVHGIGPILMTITPPTTGFQVEDYPEYQVRDSVVLFNTWLKGYADEENLPLVDGFAVLTDSNGYLDSAYASSRVDLNEQGYAAVSELVKAYLDTPAPID